MRVRTGYQYPSSKRTYCGEEIWVVLNRELVDFFVVVTENVQCIILCTIVEGLEFAEDQMNSITIIEVCISLRSLVNAPDGRDGSLLVLEKHHSHMSYESRIYPTGWKAVLPAGLECMILQ
jgi:hypothetical protein